MKEVLLPFEYFENKSIREKVKNGKELIK